MAHYKSLAEYLDGYHDAVIIPVRRYNDELDDLLKLIKNEDKPALISWLLTNFTGGHYECYGIDATDRMLHDSPFVNSSPMELLVTGGLYCSDCRDQNFDDVVNLDIRGGDNSIVGLLDIVKITQTSYYTPDGYYVLRRFYPGG
jgi:hypothetical protein